ncbi:MAG: hypothetical protein KF757_13995 [Phycisphaeraceae bacterium]|nr:hypothetical protein [Phycisphaeraceae bacterium]MCW5764074.1 hypothetical protein [Phycisphaeraceae bacterium]
MGTGKQMSDAARIGVFGVIGLAGFAAIGGVYGFAAAWVPWGIINPITTIVLCFALGFVAVQTIRLSRFRSGGGAFVFAVIGTAAFMLASALVLRGVLSPGSGLGGFLADRRQQGVVLFGSFAVSGVWLVLSWIAQALLVLAVLSMTLVGESVRPYCAACGAWAWKPCWTFRLRGPSEGAVANVKAHKTLESLTMVSRGGSADRMLVCSLGVCDCGSQAVLNASLKKMVDGSEQNPGDTLLHDSPVNSATVPTLYAWAERLDPDMRGKRPSIRAIASVLLDDADVSMLDYPQGEPATRMRWSGLVYAADGRADNILTRGLRDEIVKRGPGIIAPAIALARTDGDRAFIAEACADWQRPPVWLEAWLQAAPDAFEVHLVSGIHSVKRAWDARGGGWQPKNFGLFESRLIEAEQSLHRATELRPDDPTAWAWLIYAGKGRGHELEALYEIFKQAIRRSPFFRPAHTFFLDTLAPKWGGSRAKMLEFARKASARAPAGASVHSIVAEAHVEMGCDLERSKESTLAEYLQQVGVQQELREANNKAFRSGGIAPDMETPRTRAWFAYALWQANLTDEAAEHLRIIGTTSAWGIFGPNLPFSKSSVKRARKECGVR